MLYTGKGVEPDREKALDMLKKSKSLQTILKQVDVMSHSNSSDDREIAFKLCSDLSDINNKDICFYLAQMYRNGRGVERDVEESIEWMKKSIEYGHKGAVKELEVLMKERNRKVV